jgi:hypothetical protein
LADQLRREALLVLRGEQLDGHIVGTITSVVL